MQLFLELLSAFPQILAFEFQLFHFFFSISIHQLQSFILSPQLKYTFF